jgi:secreted trypsin-like serine protease
MRRPALALIALLASATPAAAIVGQAQATNAAAQPVQMIVSDRGSFCTATVITRDLLLTAAHCVLPSADYKLLQFDAVKKPVLRDIASIARHPQFNLQTLFAHRATADVALLKLAQPLTVAPAPLADPKLRAAVGDRFVLRGYGVAVRGDGATGGTLRSAALVATGQPGNLQLRLFDPAARNERAGLGACTGDSGAPVFAETSSPHALYGVVSWSTGPGGAAGCGGLTGVTPLSLYRSWIDQEARKLGSAINR